MSKKEERKSGELYQYDAFISYRHVQPDQLVAENLHRQLEAFKMPSNVKASLANGHTKIERVFRDEEELPIASSLEDAIVNALRNSEWLIVICSPRLVQSEWCRLEIRTFIEMHGRDHVLAVLVEGEPDDSMPEELLYEEVTVVNELGLQEVRKRRCEPLAADVRADNDKEIVKKISSSKLRLIAAMFNLNYDDLKQRHREKAIKRRLRIMSGIAVAALVVGAFSTIMMLRLNSQNKQIIAQNEKITSQAEEIEAQNSRLIRAQAENTAELALGYFDDDNRLLALQTAHGAMTSIDDVAMPYTARAEYAITTTTGVYEEYNEFGPYAMLDIAGVAERTEASDNDTYYAVIDNLENLYVWRTDTLERVFETNDVAPATFDDRKTFLFLDDSRLMYINDTGLHVVELASGSDIVLSSESISSISISPDKTKVCSMRETFFADDNTVIVTVYDATTLNVIGELTKEELCTAMALSEPVAATVEEVEVAEGGEGEEGAEPADGAVIPEAVATMYSGATVDDVWLGNDYLCYEVSVESYTLDNMSLIRVVNLSNYTVEKQYKINREDVLRATVFENVLYYTASDFSNGFCATVSAIDYNTNWTLWSTDKNYYPYSMKIATVAGANFILINSYGKFEIINTMTGDVVGEYTGASVLNTYLMGDNSLYLLSSENYRSSMPIDNGLFPDSYSRAMTTSTCTDFVTADLIYTVETRIFACKRGDSNVYVYRPNFCPDLSPLTSSTNAVGSTNYGTGSEYLGTLNNVTYYPDLSGFDSVMITYNVDDVAGVTYATESPSDDMLIVNYYDGSFSLYNEERMIIHCDDSRVLSVDSYYGTDSDGNYYVGGINGLKISPDGEVLAYISNLCGFDSSNNQIVRLINGECMTQPIFGIDELVDYSEDVIDSYEG